MTDAQIFQFIGLCFFAIGVGMRSNPKFIKNIFKELEDSDTLKFYGGLMSFAIGFLLVTFHNVWNFSSSLIITVIGWMGLAKGLMFLAFPKFTGKSYRGLEDYGSMISYGILGFGAILFILGLTS